MAASLSLPNLFSTTEQREKLGSILEHSKISQKAITSAVTNEKVANPTYKPGDISAAASHLNQSSNDGDDTLDDVDTLANNDSRATSNTDEPCAPSANNTTTPPQITSNNKDTSC